MRTRTRKRPLRETRPTRRSGAPHRCVARELEEELALSVGVGPLIDSWVYEVLPGEEVLIVTYGCCPAPFAALTHSAEHKDA